MIYRIACISRRTGNHLGYVMNSTGSNFKRVRTFESSHAAEKEAARLNRALRRKCDFVPEAECHAKPRTHAA